MMRKPLNIVISAGGTGGHILPAVAVADAIKRSYPDSAILFVGANGRMEMDLVPKKGYQIIGLDIMGLQRRFTFKNLLLPFKFMGSLWKSRKILRQQKPDAVIGFGGYASGAVLLMAQMLKIPTFIQEQNSYPGLTNKWLAKRAKRIFVSYPHMNRFFPEEKIVFAGNPIREVFFNLADKKVMGREYFSLPQDSPVVFVMGGSQGASSINRAIESAFDFFVEQQVSLIWQTGRYFQQQAQSLVEKYDVHKSVKPFVFIEDIHLAMASADLVISRAGAISIAELSAAGKAVILVPLPTAAEDHQTENAMQLVRESAAVMVKDAEVYEGLLVEVKKLVADKGICEKMQKNIGTFAKANASEIIVKDIIKEICPQ